MNSPTCNNVIYLGDYVLNKYNHFMHESNEYLKMAHEFASNDMLSMSHYFTECAMDRRNQALYWKSKVQKYRGTVILPPVILNYT